MRLPSNVTSREWERARTVVVASAHVCAVCGRPLNPHAPRTRWSTAVDHIVSRASVSGLDLQTQRFLCLDPSNLQAVHQVCNGRKGKRPQKQVRSRPQSQVW
jgi:5-methylcytosine-specific restriction endonuclease McrA